MTYQRYEVTWHTAIAPGLTHYHGKEAVSADSPEEAEALAQFNIWRRAFQDRPKFHIVITEVKAR